MNDPAGVLFEQWSLYKNVGIAYSGNDTWDSHAATRHPVARALRAGWTRSHSPPSFNTAGSVPSGLSVLAMSSSPMSDAIGELDATPMRSGMEDYLRTISGTAGGHRRTRSPTRLLFMDDAGSTKSPRLFSSASGWSKSSICVPRLPTKQRQEFAALVDDTVRRIESGLFLPHSGIRFPQNPCTTCPFIGLCLDKPDLVEAGLVRKPGVDLGLFDELVY